MTRLTVRYDPRCGLCCALRDWIGRQPQLVPVDCRPSTEPGADLRVVADTGEVWEGDSAWLMVLWALSNYRHLANGLASRPLIATGPASVRRGFRVSRVDLVRAGIAAEVESNHAV